MSGGTDAMEGAHRRHATDVTPFGHTEVQESGLRLYVDLWSGDYADGPGFEIGSPRDLGTCLC